MFVPIGMGFALLANVPPVVGIYTAVFPALVYILLGTSHHLSLGKLQLTGVISYQRFELFCFLNTHRYIINCYFDDGKSG